MIAPRPAIAHQNVWTVRQGSRYSVLGGVLNSALEFPHLPAAPCESPTSWSVRVVEGSPPERSLNWLGSREIGPERYELWEDEAGWRLIYSHAGTFDLTRDGTVITWYHPADANEELAQAIILGPVLSLALESGGNLCLHGSAVAVDTLAIGFLGGKYHGKSTLATALTAAGARLVSDDVLAFQPDTRVLRPGVPSVRLWADSAEALSVDGLCNRVEAGVKTTASGFANAAGSEEFYPLNALYLLSPVTEPQPDMPPCWREAVRGPGAAISLAHQTKLPANLVGARRAGDQLRLAAHAAAQIPIWRLHVVRDLERIDDVVAQIFAWHGAPATIAGNE